MTVSDPCGRVDLEGLKRPRLGGKEPTRLFHPARIWTEIKTLVLRRLWRACQGAAPRRDSPNCF
jgi:hypothetical protein